MKNTILRICDLQKRYSSRNTPEMKERGKLIRASLVERIRDLEPRLAPALGEFGSDFFVEGSDGKGNKVDLPWVRFGSKRMSPKATTGFYVVLHFSTDGSGVHVVVGCSSSVFSGGSNVPEKSAVLAKRVEWVRGVVQESRGSLQPFTDPNDFGARTPLTRSFQQASALVKTISCESVEDDLLEGYLISAADMLRTIYTAQEQGRELTAADQAEVGILEVVNPLSPTSRRQGYGLKPDERKVVELRAMEVAKRWLEKDGYSVTDTSASKPYDFQAVKSGKSLLVEVKGTTSDFAEAILMTYGEVDLHRSHKGNTALFIVSQIRLDKSAPAPVAIGGKLEVFIGWDIDVWQAEPTAYRLTRP